MPGGDRTGPEGKGQMTGRRMGLCVDKNEGLVSRQQGDRRFGQGRRLGLGRGPGRGFRAKFRGWLNSENEPTTSEIKQIKVKRKKKK